MTESEDKKEWERIKEEILEKYSEAWRILAGGDMKIKHTFCTCLACKAILEIFDSDIKIGEVICHECGYENELDDIRLEVFEEEF